MVAELWSCRRIWSQQLIYVDAEVEVHALMPKCREVEVVIQTGQQQQQQLMYSGRKTITMHTVIGGWAGGRG